MLFKAWAAAAQAARINPDPMSDVYNANSNKLDEEQSEKDQAMEIISGVAKQQQSLSRYPNLPYTNHIKDDEEGAFSHDSVVIESNGEGRDNKNLGKIRIENEDEEEEPSNPRGFYYSFDYPVQLILENSDERQQRSVPVSKKGQNDAKTDKSELNSPLDAEVAEYKIVKRSENSKDATHIKDILDKEFVSSAIEKDEEKRTQEEKRTTNENLNKRNISQPQQKRVEDQIPVIVKVESENLPSDFLVKTETELRRLASNEDVIDAVHDTQVHRRVKA